MSQYQIKTLTDTRLADWDHFVEKQCENATFFHKAGWKKVIEKTFKHPTFYLYAEKEGQICGVMPLVQVKSFLFGNNLVSIPFGVYGGVASEDAKAIELLEQKAIEIAESKKVDALECKNTQKRHEDWPTKDLYYTFRKAFSDNDEENLKAIPRKQRAMVRKGIKAGLKGEMETGIDSFFKIYSTSVRNLGTPVFPKKLFKNLRDEFKADCDILLIKNENTAIAAVMSFYFRDQVLPFYGGSLPEARRLKGNDFMYWDLMCRSAQRGYRLFDFGRSKKGTGAFSFKKNWGFEPEPLYYQYHLVQSQAMPEINPNNPKYKLLIKVWKKLPTVIANPLASFLSPYLG